MVAQLNALPFLTALLVRTFMFLGFLVVPSKHPLAPRGDYVSLMYTLDDDADAL